MAGTRKQRGSRLWRKSEGGQVRFYRPQSPSELGNTILAKLPQEERSELQQHLVWVPLKLGDVLWEPNQSIKSVYFPNCGMVSLVIVMRNGAMAEVGITGREGFVGTSVVLGAHNAPIRATVQSEGNAFKIRSELLQQLLPRTPQLAQMLRRYAHIQAMQVSQAAGCNCLHQVPERLARWLTMSSDRIGPDSLPVTHEFLSQMLGCGRSSITSAIGQLQKAGILQCGRGRICIVDRKQLERRACECYDVMRKLSDGTRLG